MNRTKDWITDEVELWICRVQKEKEILRDRIIGEIYRGWKPQRLPPAVTAKIYTKVVLERMKDDSRLQATSDRFIYIGTMKGLHNQEQSKSSVNNLPANVRSDSFALNETEGWVAGAVELWVDWVQRKKEMKQSELKKEVNSWKKKKLPPLVTAKQYAKVVLAKMRDDSRLQTTSDRFYHIGAGEKLDIQCVRAGLSVINLPSNVRSDPFALRNSEALCAPVPCMTYEEMALLDNELYESMEKLDCDEGKRNYDEYDEEEDDKDEEENKAGEDEEDSIFKWKGEDDEDIVFKRNDGDNSIPGVIEGEKDSVFSKLYKYFFGSSTVSIRDKGVALADGEHASQFLEASLFGQLVVDPEFKGRATEQKKIFLVKSFKTFFDPCHFRTCFIH